jgi:hypothetical protein
MKNYDIFMSKVIELRWSTIVLKKDVIYFVIVDVITFPPSNEGG